jgi:hypothetical protein
LLPVPTSPLHNAVNREVEREIQVPDTHPSSSRKRKRYGEYSGEMRAKIARFAIEHGNTAAAKHFSKELENDINESTVRSMKTSYQKLKNRSNELFRL